MSVILAIALAKFIDPIFFLLNLLLTALARRWWTIPIVGLISATAYQAVLADDRVHAFIAAWIAMTMQAFLASTIWAWFRGMKGKPQT